MRDSRAAFRIAGINMQASVKYVQVAMAGGDINDPFGLHGCGFPEFGPPAHSIAHVF